MSYVQLDLAKAHLAVIQSDDDLLIQQCIDAAEGLCANFMNRPGITDAQPVGLEWPNAAVPPEVVQSVLLYCAELYEQRTVGAVGGSYTRLPTADMMLHLHRVALGV